MKKQIKVLTISLLTMGFVIFLITNCTSEEKDDKTEATVPVVSTNDVYNITYTTAEVGGTIVSDGKSKILGSGFCWGRGTSPTIDSTHTSDGAQTGDFRTNMTNLEEGTTYYVRAYATNAVGTGYGSEKTFTTGLSCQTMVSRHPGYQVWAGNTPYFQETNHYDYFYSIDKYGYTLIGESTTTQTFNTGTYKYYVIVSKYWNCLDAIQFSDGSYYDHGQGYTLYTGLTDVSAITGPPDGIYGKFGYKTLCPPGGTATFNGYITDDATITSRGGGLKVIVGIGCQ